jgi:putative transposase
MSQQGMRTFSTEFKEAVVVRLDAGERMAAVSDELKIRRKLLYEWRAAYRELGAAGLNRKRGRKPGGARASADCRARAQDRQAADGPRFFSRSLAAHRRTGPHVSRDAIYAVIEEMNARETQGAPSIEHLCRLSGVSRAGFYRFGEVRAPKRAEADLRDKIQTIALKNRFYGYRRVCRDLWRVDGLKVNHKHVLRLMREDNLLRLRERPFVPYTTNSRHEFPIVANLTRGRVPTGLDQIWVADITYVRLAGQFVYLAVVLDAFSRRVIGWALADHLEASLAIEALDMALTARSPEPGLIHHSDRGVQYACADYCDKLAARGALISMSRAGNPYDNAKAERFMRTLKEEEVNGKTYASVDDARAHIGAFLENVYNRARLHSALGYKPPVEFEAELRQCETV